MKTVGEFLGKGKHLVLREKHHLSLPEAGVLVEDLPRVIGMLAGARQIFGISWCRAQIGTLDVHFDLGIAPEPRLLHVENARELEINPRRKRLRAAAASPAAAGISA